MCDPGFRHESKRRFLQLAALLPSLAGCGVPRAWSASTDTSQQRFEGVRGLVLVVDAVAGEEMRQVVLLDDRGVQLYSAAAVARTKRGIVALGSGRVPISVNVTWGKDRPYDFGRAIWHGGTILGNHTIPVAVRIPDEVLHDIRAHRGNLRLKFRLKPDGVLFGWDIERPNRGTSKFEFAGGDFLETWY